MSNGDASPDLPEPIAEAVRLALADLQRPTPVPLVAISYEPDGEQAGFGVMYVECRAEGTAGFGLNVGARRADTVVEVASRLQEVLQETDAAWAEPRPPCLGHPHPSKAQVIDGVACWVCPTDGHVVARIGSVHSG